MSSVNPIRFVPPVAVNVMVNALEGIITQFRQGKTRAVLHVSDYYARAEMLETKSSMLVTQYSEEE